MECAGHRSVWCDPKLTRFFHSLVYVLFSNEITEIHGFIRTGYWEKALSTLHNFATSIEIATERLPL